LDRHPEQARASVSSDNESPEMPAQVSESALFGKVIRLLEEHKLEIAKNWLSRVIADIQELSVLEHYPTQESIRASLYLLEGLARLLEDERIMREFQPGGKYYERASLLGMAGGGGATDIQSVSQSMQALENSIWENLTNELRRDDRELLRLVVRLRAGLAGIALASTEACYRQANTELDRIAHTDALTELFNRRYLLRELDRHVEMYKRYRHPFSILMLDLDNLKWLNDTHGHAAGDAALRHVATLMRVNIRDVDIPCRYGGDEFIILMPDTEKDVVEIVGRRIADSLRKTKLKVAHSLVALDVGTGSASCPVDGTDTEELIKEADASLYRHKQRKTEQESESGNR